MKRKILGVTLGVALAISSIMPASAHRNGKFHFEYHYFYPNGGGVTKCTTLWMPSGDSVYYGCVFYAP